MKKQWIHPTKAWSIIIALFFAPMLFLGAVTSFDLSDSAHIRGILAKVNGGAGADHGSATGAPTCTFATATTCNDVATALTVAAGDVITLSLTTSSSSETASTVAVSFELWN